MLILILIDVQYPQKAGFSFEKGSTCPIKISDSPPPPPRLHTHTSPTFRFCYLENPRGGAQYLFKTNFPNNS